MTPSNTDHVREKRAVACIASLSPKLGSEDSELSLEGVELIEDDDTLTLIMDEPVNAHHFLGIDIDLKDAEGTLRKCVLSQHKFCQHVLKYFLSISPNLILRKVNTPANDSISILGLGDDCDKKGMYSGVAARLIGMLLWLMRGTRGEIAVALSCLGSFVTKWNVECDGAVTRVMAYLQTYPNMVLELHGDSRDLTDDGLVSETFCDSDHGSDKLTSRSMSGALSFIMGKNGTKALMGWFGVKMKSAGVSTGEVETCAASVSLRRLALPLAGCLEFLLVPMCVKIRTKLRGDATVAEQCFASARSAKMRYLRKVHRISIHFVHDVFQIEGIDYEHVDTHINCSDLITKPLVKDVHFKHCTFMGLVVLDENGTVLAMAAASKGNKELELAVAESG